MSDIQNNFNQNILNLISDSVFSPDFMEFEGDYIRMSVFDRNGVFIKSYYSNLTWYSNPVHYQEGNNLNIYQITDIYKMLI